MIPFMDRREFVKDSTVLAALAAAGLNFKNESQGAESAARAVRGDVNDQLRVAVVGVRGRGMSHVGGFAGKNNCQVTTICDCDESVIGGAMKSIEKTQGKAPKYEKDFRKLLDDKSIDIVSIATPNHWHALMAIWAIQAGKDVYVEKPVSHNVSEGRRIVEAARKYDKICQTGTQSRSNPGMRQSMQYVLDGKIGKTTLSRGLCYKSRPSIGQAKGEQAIPKTLDFDLWCGPAKLTPLTRQRLHYDWHWTWEYGNGDLGNQGIHEMDKARWGLGKMELPKSVFSLGGRFGYVDDGETANTQVCVFDYGDSSLIFEVRGLPSKDLLGSKVGNIFYGTEGYLVCPNYSTGIAFNKDNKEVARFSGGSDQLHFDNFIKAVRARKREILNADILEGHLSSALCHLGNISYRLGKEVTLNGQVQELQGDTEGQEAVTRMVEHLKGNKVDLAGAKVRVGPKLAFDPKKEKFLANAEADKMLTREYRKGFEVPEKI
ncbi:MAG: Gfo/Idh/MocA family oxidoreductase [Gemmataceae bacterium]|nr:Gfo/Idh/MocA family oxidoreductase [Gemmataceae bacterium]